MWLILFQMSEILPIYSSNTFDVLVIGVLDGDLLLVLQGMTPEMEEREGGSESAGETEIETDEATLAEGVAERNRSSWKSMKENCSLSLMEKRLEKQFVKESDRSTCCYSKA